MRALSDKLCKLIGAITDACDVGKREQDLTNWTNTLESYLEDFSVYGETMDLDAALWTPPAGPVMAGGSILPLTAPRPLLPKGGAPSVRPVATERPRAARRNDRRRGKRPRPGRV